MGFLKLEFHPTGEGRVLCRCFYADGSEGRAIHYYDEKPLPMGLSDSQIEEWSIAWELENG